VIGLLALAIGAVVGFQFAGCTDSIAAPAPTSPDEIDLASTEPATVTGLAAPPQNRQQDVCNVGTAPIVFVIEDARSIARHRFRWLKQPKPVYVDVPLEPGYCRPFFYRSHEERWLVGDSRKRTEP